MVLFTNLKHGSDEVVDFLLSVSPISILSEGVVFNVPSTSGIVELEGEEEVVGLLEVLLALGDFLNEVLNAGDTELAEVGFDDGVIGKGDSGSVDLSEASLVNQFSNDFSAGVAVSDVGLDSSQHVQSSLVDFHQDTVVELSQSEKLQDLLDLGVHLVDTLGSDHEGDFGFGGNVEVAGVSGLSFLGDESGFSLNIGLVVFLGLVFPFFSSGLDEGLSLLSLLGQLNGFLAISLLLSSEGLGDETKIKNTRLPLGAAHLA